MLLPAVLDVLGPASWRLPRWLDRLLPRLNVEGSPDHVPPFDRVEAMEEELQLAPGKRGRGRHPGRCASAAVFLGGAIPALPPQHDLVLGDSKRHPPAET
jgi:hypothetical protein